MNMTRNWLEVARMLAEGARAKLAEDRRRLEAMQTQMASRQAHSGASSPAR